MYGSDWHARAWVQPWIDRGRKLCIKHIFDVSTPYDDGYLYIVYSVQVRVDHTIILLAPTIEERNKSGIPRNPIPPNGDAATSSLVSIHPFVCRNQYKLCT